MFSLVSLIKLKALAGVYLGWGIGANDTANMFGTAVAARLLTYRMAITLGAIFTLAGAVISGAPLMDDVGALLPAEFNQSGSVSVLDLSFIACMAGAIAIHVVTYLGIPASTSQAAVGAMMGLGIALAGFHGSEWGQFGKMFGCWIIAPVGSAIITMIFTKVLVPLFNRYVRNEIIFHRIIKFLLMASGAYGCYMLGATHAAVCTGVFYKAGFFGEVGLYSSKFWAATAGGVGISLGVLTYSRKVIETVGKKITDIDPFSAFMTVFAAAITVHIFKEVGVPVSTSQQIVGAVVGSGLIRAGQNINVKSLMYIFIGWILTPLAGGLIAWGGYQAFVRF